MKSNLFSRLFSLTFISVLFSCEAPSEIDQTIEQQEVEDTLSNNEPLTPEKEESDFPLEPLDFAKMIAEKLETDSFDDWEAFSSSEVFFSPYAYVDTNSLVMISSEGLSNLFSSDQKMIWGIQDGTGDTLKLNFSQYEERYINDFDLMDTSQVNYSIVNEPQAHGNEVHNIHHLYPEAVLVAAHKPADDEMGMNWRSLIFVIKEINGELKLLGLVHNEWTI